MENLKKNLGTMIYMIGLGIFLVFLDSTLLFLLGGFFLLSAISVIYFNYSEKLIKILTGIGNLLLMIVLLFTNLSLALFLLLFIFTIAWHEFGHLIPAKLFGTKIEEFSIGMGTKLFGFNYKGTEYNLRGFLLGGYVLPIDSVDTTGDKKSNKPYMLMNRKLWQKIVIYLGGVIMNLLFGYILLFIIFSIHGMKNLPTMSKEDPMMHYLSDNIGCSIFVGKACSDEVYFSNDRYRLTVGGILKEGMRFPLLNYYGIKYFIGKDEYDKLYSSFQSPVGVSRYVSHENNLWSVVFLTMVINFGMFLINLVPLPPLDGYVLIRDVLMTGYYRLKKVQGYFSDFYERIRDSILLKIERILVMFLILFGISLIFKDVILLLIGK